MDDLDASPPGSDEAARPNALTSLDVSGAKLSDSRIARMLGMGNSATTYRVSFDWQPPAVEELRKALPQYDVQQFLACGGMGAVYRGYQKNLERIVAIKVLPPVFDRSGQFAERFKHEAKSMAKLVHPGIVGVFDAGETDEGMLYIIMEFVEGTDVAHLLANEGHLKAEQALTIVSAVCDALAFAHENGILHRDIKPSNVLLDRRGRVKIMDFGLSKEMERGPASLTASDVAVGTADFIAPEILIPGTLADARADLYAVGVMLYQMLTGHLPRGRFELPSIRVPGLDKAIDQLVDRALQAEPARRHSSALEMRQELDRLRQKSGSWPVPEPEIARDKSPTIKKWGMGAFAGMVALGISMFTLGKSRSHEAERTGTGMAFTLAPSDSAGTSSLLKKMPIGTWIPIKADMLGAQMKTITFSTDGAWRLTHALSLPGLLAKDVAVRTRVRRPEEVEHTGIRVQMRGPFHRSIDLGRDDTMFQAVFSNGKRAAKYVPHAPGIGVEQPVLLELAAVGDLTCAAIDGVVLPPLRTFEPSSRGGIMLWSQNAEFRDVEVMILDGVPEDRSPAFVLAAMKMESRKDSK